LILKDESLNPHVMAAKILSSGKTGKDLVTDEFELVFPERVQVTLFTLSYCTYYLVGLKGGDW
jgi:hypothetical protein